MNFRFHSAMILYTIIWFAFTYRKSLLLPRWALWPTGIACINKPLHFFTLTLWINSLKVSIWQIFQAFIHALINISVPTFSLLNFHINDVQSNFDNLITDNCVRALECDTVITQCIIYYRDFSMHQDPY